MNGDPGSTQILTRHYGAQSQTISQLESSRTTATSKSPQLKAQPLRVIATPADGVDAYATPHSANPDETVGLH
jgi:hypothetical protein